MKRLIRSLIWITISIAVVWTVLTVWAEIDGPEHTLELGNNGSSQTAIIVYDPDPFYNLDQQLCESFGKGLADNGWKVIIATVRTAKKLKSNSFQLYVFCANTYNWYPDWSITNFIKKYVDINGRNIVAITVGAGSTGNSRQVLENIIKRKKGNLIGSKTFWLLRPNEETGVKRKNIAMAIDITRKWSEDIALLAKAKTDTQVQ